MMAPVPYTRAAVQRIRDGASAADLGWSATMFERVCRDHGIDPLARRRVVPVAAAVVEAAPPSDALRFDAKTGEIFHEGLVIALPRVQAQIFAVLYDAYRMGNRDFIPAGTIHRLTENDADCSTVPTAIRRIKVRLAKLPLTIESKNGHNGGSRLKMDS